MMGMFSNDEQHIEMPPCTTPEYDVRKRVQVGRGLVVKVWFRDYGYLIMVYRDSTLEVPHPIFGGCGAIAHFYPSQEGWDLALKFAETL